MSAESPSPTNASFTETTRHGLLFIATATMGAAGAAAALVPLFDQMIRMLRPSPVAARLTFIPAKWSLGGRPSFSGGIDQS